MKKMNKYLFASVLLAFAGACSYAQTAATPSQDTLLVQDTVAVAKADTVLAETGMQATPEDSPKARREQRKKEKSRYGYAIRHISDTVLISTLQTDTLTHTDTLVAEQRIFSDSLFRIEDGQVKVEFYLYTGCRRSEALTVTKYDIDTVSMTLRIRGTKSKTSDRVMPISKPLEYVINRVITSADPYLFHVTGDYVSRAFKALCPNHKLHDLRHTFATHCLQCGVSMKVLQLWLGHASFETTASIYTHVVDAFQRTEASKIAWF